MRRDKRRQLREPRRLDAQLLRELVTQRAGEQVAAAGLVRVTQRFFRAGQRGARPGSSAQLAEVGEHDAGDLDVDVRQQLRVETQLAGELRAQRYRNVRGAGSRPVDTQLSLHSMPPTAGRLLSQKRALPES
jgi:hypothetical protein